MYTHTYRFIAVKLRCEQQQSKQCSLFFSLVFCDIIIFSWWEKRDCICSFKKGKNSIRHSILKKQALGMPYLYKSDILCPAKWLCEVMLEMKAGINWNFCRNDDFTLDGWTDIFGNLCSFLLRDDYANLRDRFCSILLCWSAADGDEMRGLWWQWWRWKSKSIVVVEYLLSFPSAWKLSDVAL